MIRIDKQRKPDYLDSNEVDLALEKMETFFLSTDRGQKRYDWPFTNEIDFELKKILYRVFSGKCGYCETLIEEFSLGVVDRYRPYDGVRDKSSYFEDLYWWLAFDWDNLVFCCKECNQFKANYFPIKGKRAEGKTSKLAEEQGMLVNPYDDNPKDHFEYSNSGEIIAKTEKGLQTIELLRLDRTDLIQKRLVAAKELNGIFQSISSRIKTRNSAEIEYLKSIFNENDKGIPFLAFKRHILLDELEIDPFLGRILDLDDDDQDRERKVLKRRSVGKKILTNDIITSDYFPIEYIHIKNFKSIADLKIDFKSDELNRKSWLFLLGENGAGKSSILQAIAIGLKLDINIADADRLSSLVKKGQAHAEIQIKERNSNNVILTKINSESGSIEQKGKFESYLIGYGSLRLSIDEVEKRDAPKDILKVSYANIFIPTKALNDVTKWLTAIQKENIDFFDRIAYSIKQLLPHDKPDTNLSIRNGKIVLGDSATSFSDLSDGYKSTITLAIDIMMKLSDAQSDMDKMSGIVLIDELGNQLHPRWQMRIVSQLRKVFPNINFIVSTHHPLCLRGADKEEILLLRNVDELLVGITDLPNPASLRVDQILASEFFGLSSLVDPDIEAQFNLYYELLSKGDSASPSERDKINELRDFLREKRQLGNSLREELMYAVIDKLLAEKVSFNYESVSRKELKEEAVRRVKEIWKNLNIDNND